jgi:hypothetical protein
MGHLVSINNIYLFWPDQVQFWPTKPIRYLSSIATPRHFWLNQMSFWVGYSFLNTFWSNVQFDTWLNRLPWTNCLIKNYTCHLTLELPIKIDMFRGQKESFSQVVWFDKPWIMNSNNVFVKVTIILRVIVTLAKWLY